MDIRVELTKEEMEAIIQEGVRVKFAPAFNSMELERIEVRAYGGANLTFAQPKQTVASAPVNPGPRPGAVTDADF